ncbi:MAG: long-chain fatty acid--CoA ligase [Bacteriovoracaceae bacterium]|nr:long-chain fatty acid--CoA ligase [Bacteriovoracaceae bacterium]
MNLIQKLSQRWQGLETPFLIYKEQQISFEEISSQSQIDLSEIKPGSVVAVIGDFNPQSILILLQLIDLNVIIVPLTNETKEQHEYFFETALVDFVIDNGKVSRRKHDMKHDLIESLRAENHAGLVLFSTGTTGRPKAILHDMTLFLRRFETPRPTLRTINFLLFDHIGGINTLFHTLFNKGVVIAPEARTVESILKTCEKYEAEVLPTTPTFLRMMLMSGVIPEKIPSCLKIITYGTERMDQPTLDELCRLLPDVEFRQTFGMSELGIVRAKSVARNSLFMKIGGEGVETRVVDNVLQIKSQTRMLGYLNAPSPFDNDGWYDSKDVVEVENGAYKIVGRVSDVINVGGLKFMASEIERIALDFPGVVLVKAYAKKNPITGQHVELKVQPSDKSFNKNELTLFLKEKLQPHMMPKRIVVEEVEIGHRYKKV